MLADRAIDGIEEPVFHRGELVGTRRRYDTRLLLAHIARLDILVDEEAASADAECFDELVACIAGEEPPEPLTSNNITTDLESAKGGTSQVTRPGVLPGPSLTW